MHNYHRQKKQQLVRQTGDRKEIKKLQLQASDGNVEGNPEEVDTLPTHRGGGGTTDEEKDNSKGEYAKGRPKNAPFSDNKGRNTNMDAKNCKKKAKKKGTIETGGEQGGHLETGVRVLFDRGRGKNSIGDGGNRPDAEHPSFLRLPNRERRL